MTDEATLRQIAAADPARSTWLTANAGSGKTRVLTDRVARLLLAGTAPERILCLTYTRAAAAEMQNRLLARLGRWAMLPDAELRGELAQMGVTEAPDLPQARRLFARAIETPGGLKVQTIHAFCASILRRFPLEAGVPVGFTELDERSDDQLRAEIVEAMAEAAEPEIDDLVTLAGDAGLGRFLGLVTRADCRLGAPCDTEALWRLAGLPHPYEAEELLDDVLHPRDADLLAALHPLMAKGKPTDIKLAARMASLDWNARMAVVEALEDMLLTGEGAKQPFTAKIGKIPTKDLHGSCSHLLDDLNGLMARVEAGRPRRIALDFAQRSRALHRFACRFNGLYAAEKLRRGWLSFDDLIARTAALLSRASMAQWVLFRLDGGIDHILVDEAQDTNPDQWQVIERLAAEFTAGEGARGDAAGRTLFVVGDPKQSIYSFQGADIAVFGARKASFGGAFAAIGRPMQDAALQFSFRSSPVVLSVVDRVFDGPAAQGLGGPTLHRAFNTGQPGRVDLWPAIEPAETPEDLPWDATAPQVEAPLPEVRLAEAVEARIAAMLGQPITDRHGVTRPIVPGDILILVQRRGVIFDAIIRRLKTRGLAVAGADRMKLTADLAVRDIRAVLAFLATPEDDLSLAAVLRSPLFDVDEAALWRLAAGRAGYLWAALREAGPDLAPGLAGARALLSDLLGVSGQLRPHDLIARLLIRHDGRSRLLARLGDEALDGIDELLGQALTYERTGVPSLTGFLVWLGDDTVEVKRPGGAGEAGGMIRVMTVHGAKGLESPVVILPDTAIRKPPQPEPVLPMPEGPAVIRPNAGLRPPVVDRLITELQARQEEERRRLLYVAMTRAESWLIVAGAGKTGEGTDSWHAMVAEGFALAQAVPGLVHAALPDDGAGAVQRLSFGPWPEAPVAAPPPTEAAAPVPDWLTRAPAPTAPPPGPRPATGLGGAKVVAGAGLGTASGEDPGDGLGAEAAMLAGTRLHLLLEHLPGIPPAERPGRARALLAGAEGGLPAPDDLAALLAEAGALIDAPDLAAVFTPRPGDRVLREVSLSASLPGIGLLVGTVDRLIVAEDRILAVDYKSNAVVPADAAAVPLGILRQMAAYREALRRIWPGRPVEAAVLWTTARSLMALPDGVLDRALAPLLQGSPAP